MPSSPRRNGSGFPPLDVAADGFAPVTVASRFGKLSLRRQVLEPQDGSPHRIPANAFLPPHAGIIITRGLQEWAWLLTQELSFATASRLLGWQPQPEPLLSDTTLRTLVRQHGQTLCEAEHAEAHDSEEWLDKLISYLREPEPYIPHYGERRRTSQYIGSGQVEKANDQIVAQRQKGAGMRWSLDTSDALAALRTLKLNGGWDDYWVHRRLPSLLADSPMAFSR